MLRNRQTTLPNCLKTLISKRLTKSVIQQKDYEMWHENNTDKFIKCSSYDLTFPDCNIKYVRQTGRSFLIRYKECVQDFKYSSGKSRFSQHLLGHGHSIGPVYNIMVILQIVKKGTIIEYFRKLYIYIIIIRKSH